MDGVAKIGPVWYEIFGCRHLEDGGQKLDGQVKHGTSQILIDEELSPQSRRVTLWHEIFHIILTQVGQSELSKNEDFVESISHKLMQVVVDNPWLAESVCSLVEKSYFEARE